MSGMKEKVALVTGASRGIGRAIALKLAEAGVNLAINGKSKSNLKLLQKELSNKGVDVLMCAYDLVEPDAPKEIIQKVIAHYDKLDILINNAGTAGFSRKNLEVTSTEEWDFIMAVNARAPFLLCREALPFLKKSDFATIINVTSVNGTIGYVKQGAYTASKHALRGMTKVLAKEVFEDNIRVHIIAPGGVDTDMLTKNRPEFEHSMLTTPEEIADIAMFFLNQRENRMVIDEIRSHRYSKEPWQ